MSLPPAIQPLRCSNPHCGVDSGGRCARADAFDDYLSECPDLIRVAKDEATSTAEEPQPTHVPTSPSAPIEEDSDPAPWSGRHLGRAEALHFMGNHPCRVIAIVGPYDSGKTCLITSFFLQLANGQSPVFPYKFAGSRSLLGFHTLVQQLATYQGKPGEQALDHTVTGESDDADSFLHLALRPESDGDNRVVDLLLSDIPGEWFSDWTKRDNEQARQRLPFLQRCDGFIVLADSSTLLGEGGSRLDSGTHQLLRRIDRMMHDSGRRVPVTLVLSKYDRIWPKIGDPPEQAEAKKASSWGDLGPRLRRTFNAMKTLEENGTKTRIVPISAIPRPLDQGQPIGVIDLFAWMLPRLDERHRHKRLQLPIAEGTRPFVTMRREVRP